MTYLLAWNPKRAPWTERHGLMKKLAQGEPAVTQWGMISKAVEPGDRMFVIRLGVAPKGIFACGSALSSSYMDDHWNETKRAEGKRIRCVDLSFNELLDPDYDPIIALEQLQVAPFNEMHWMIQGSGTFMPGLVADALDCKWQQHVHRVRAD